MPDTTARTAERDVTVPTRLWHGRLGTDFGRRWSHLARRAGSRAPRPTVLLEEPRSLRAYAHWRQLSDGGYEPLWCPGPGGRNGRCPLVAGGRCVLAEQADVIVCALNRRRRPARDVVVALRPLRPDRLLVSPGPGQPPSSTGDGPRTTTVVEAGAILELVASALAGTEGARAERPGLG